MKFPPLYLIADPACYKEEYGKDPEAFFEGIREAVAGGLRLVQYRDKFRSRGEMFEIAKQLREITRKEGAALIINDQIDLAMAIKADGVHLGQNDFPVSMARQLLGETALIGLSTHHLKEVREAASQAVDYIGFGPIFPTPTKQTHDPALGIAGLAKIRGKIPLPIYAIGGIRFSHLQDLVAAGASGVAVASALQGADRKTLEQWQSTLERTLEKRRLKELH